jgi:hypothetical protein
VRPDREILPYRGFLCAARFCALPIDQYSALAFRVLRQDAVIQ